MDVKQAIRIAKDYVESVYAEVGISNVLLEEVVPSEDGSKWHITIGFDRGFDRSSKQEQASSEESDMGMLEFRRLLAGRPLDRDYKRVTVDDETGEVVSMEIRSFAAVE